MAITYAIVHVKVDCLLVPNIEFACATRFVQCDTSSNVDGQEKISFLEHDMLSL